MDEGPKPEFLLHCFGIGINDGETPEFGQLSESDWNSIIVLADRHKVAPLLYFHFAKNPVFSSVPAYVIQKLKESYLHTFRDNTRIYHELSKVLRTLNENSIPTIILKGAALAELIYQDIALRPMNDVDIVVKAEDAWRIDEVLAPLGYRSDALSRHHVQWLPHIARNRNLEIDINPVVFELPKIDPWINARHVQISSNEAFILGPEDSILHILLHLDRHYTEDGYCILIWWFDVKKLLESYINEINWDYVIQVAREYEAEGSVRRILHAIDRWFGVSIPADILNQLQDSGIITNISGILEAPAIDKHDYEELDSVLLSLSSVTRLPSFRKKVYHLFKRMFPDKEHIMRRYSIKRPKIAYFYYLIRAGEVFIKGIKAFLKLPGYLKDKCS